MLAPNEIKERHYSKDNIRAQQMIEEIIELFRKGYSYTKCVKYLVSNKGITRQTAYKYIQDAYLELYEKPSKDLNLIKAKYIDRIESMLEKAIESNNLVQAARLQEMLNKLNGLYIEHQEVKVDSDTIKFKFDS